MEKLKVNPYSIDHLVVNVEGYYQKNQEFIEEVNSQGLPYLPKKGKGTRGFQASNLWLGEEYLEFIHIKTKDGGGWISKWVEKYHAGHRGLIGLFLKTKNIEETTEKLSQFGISESKRITIPLFFNLIKLSAKWRNAYLPFFSKSPFQIGFQQVDNKKIEKRMHTQMVPNSQDQGITGIKSITYYGPFTEDELEWLKKIFICIEEKDKQLIIPLEKGQSLSICISSEVKTEVQLFSQQIVLSPLIIENVIITSSPPISE
ncbi:hypothetical protein IGI37_001036 [Enterococcus sp. AZ194]|uniref:VOC family protein n=1 Tax=Enterococcus sp. AZ194 TaxID=2774629 RepID=UPI003F1E76F2